MTLHLAEHDAAGRARYLISTDPPAPDLTLNRPLDTLDEPVRSIAAGPWIAAAFACLTCSFGWAVVAPASVNQRKLECLRCGACNSAPVLNGWCSACGAESRIAQEAGAPAEGGECPVCHAMAVIVEAA